MNRPRKTAELIPQGQGADRNGEETVPLTPEASEAYINRELSWLGGFVPLEQVIARYLNLMFPNGVRWDSYGIQRTHRRDSS